MGIQINVEKALVWDYGLNVMVSKSKVMAALVTNKGSIMFEEGPLYCNTGQEIFEASQMLRERLVNHLPGIAPAENDARRIL